MWKLFNDQEPIRIIQFYLQQLLLSIDINNYFCFQCRIEIGENYCSKDSFKDIAMKIIHTLYSKKPSDQLKKICVDVIIVVKFTCDLVFYNTCIH